MQKTTYLSIGLTTILVSALGYVSVMLGKGGWHHEDKGESFDYITEPISKSTDVTESAKKLWDFYNTEYSEKEVVKVGENIYVAIGWALANSIMIEGDDGVIIVDTTESPDSMKSIMVEFRKITDKPVVAIIFTHFHIDHNVGTFAIIEEEKKVYPNVTIEIYSHYLTRELMFGWSDTYEIGFNRGLRQVGGILPRQENPTGSGIGPFVAVGTNSNLEIPTPTIVFENRAKYFISGVEVVLIHSPGETDDQITVWLPKERAALPGDNIYRTFPNLYAIRGSPARNSKRWYDSIDKIMALGPEYLVMSHTQPQSGEDGVRRALQAYRDGIKYVHDQSVRLLNKGMFPTQIVDQIKLPDYLAKHPFLQEHYGTVRWSVRGVFANYLGWFSGNPRDLDPMTDREHAKRMSRLVAYAQTRKCNPVEVMLQEAQISHQNSQEHFKLTGKHLTVDDKWALELADAVLEMDHINENLTFVARQIKISALTAIGVEEVSPNGRNYYLTVAMEIELNLKIERTKSARAYVINTSTMDRVLGTLCSKVNGLVCQHKAYTVQFTFTDDTDYVVTLRNSVCDVIKEPAKDLVADANVHLTTESVTLKGIYAEDLDLDTELGLRSVQVKKGNINDYKEFMGCFDPVNSP